jgi:penicillin-binding protein 1A
MLIVPNDKPPSAAKPAPDTGESGPVGKRTAAAAAELVRAVGRDLAALAASAGYLLSVLGRLAPQPGLPRRGARTPHRRLSRLALALAAAGIGAMLAVSGALLWALLGLPIDRPANRPRQPTLMLEAADGEALGRTGPLTVAEVPLHGFSPILVQAVLSVEDRRFYRHPGVDVIGILRAERANRAAGDVVEGGSTITQQLVKNEYLNDDRTYVRKLREALIALWLELHLSKDQILTRYLNRVYLGDGAYGMAAAARLYFDKSPTQLTLAEAAMLAGLIKAPSEFDPLRHPAAAQQRAAEVLDAMVANHVIDRNSADFAKAHPARVNPPRALTPARSWFADWVEKSAEQLTGAQTGSIRVRTTLIPGLQALAQQTLDDALARQGRILGVSEGALVAMRPDGAVLAMVGGRDYRSSQFNRATNTNRQPGSAFKLFVYLAALRKGYTPQDTIDAGPIDISGWEPANFDDEHYGRITLADAFAKSVNTAAVRLAMDIGLANVVAAARDLGLTEPLPMVPSLALGSVGVSLLDLTGAFASVRADHMRLRPWGVAAEGAPNGSRMLATAPEMAGQSLDPYQKPLIELLRGVVEHGTGRAAALPGFAAGKTGTSQNYRDAWFIGFNERLVVGVWVGNDDDSPMRRVVGGGLPASIWKDFMVNAMPLLEQQNAAAAVAASAASAAPSGLAGALDEAVMQGSSEANNPACDIAACSSFYHSFRPSDCTYQPFGGGPRQICEKTEESMDRAITDEATSEAQSPAKLAAATPAPDHCNVDLCARTYSSFDASNCTYQPFGGGPRQLCLK